MMIEKEGRQFPRARKVGSIESASLAAGEREFFILLTKAESGKRKAESGKRKAESGKRKAESGKRKAESGKRKAESGKRKAESGKRKARTPEFTMKNSKRWGSSLADYFS